MNERIKELADEAWSYADSRSSDGNGKFGELYTEKLAELIIRECAKVASEYDGADYVGTAIENHFDIE